MLNPARLMIAMILTAILFVMGSAQDRTKESNAELLKNLAEDEKAVAACEKKLHENQIKQFGKILPKVGGHCMAGCPILLAKPGYSPEARRLELRGEVIVEAIVDERGDVVYSRIVNGNPFLRQAALAAAAKSRYQQTITCENKAVMSRRRIRYYFHPSM